MKTFFNLLFKAFLLTFTLQSTLSIAMPKIEDLETLMCKNYATSVLYSYFKLTKIQPPQSLIKPARKVAFDVLKKKGGVKDFLKASKCHMTVEEGASTFAYLKRLDSCLNSYIGKKPKESKPHKEKFETAVSEALKEVNQFFIKGPL